MYQSKQIVTFLSNFFLNIYIVPLRSASSRRQGQEEVGHEASRGAGAEEEIGRRGSEEEDSASGQTVLLYFVVLSVVVALHFYHTPGFRGVCVA